MKSIFSAVAMGLLMCAGLGTTAWASSCIATPTGGASCDTFDLGMPAVVQQVVTTDAAQTDAINGFWAATGADTILKLYSSPLLAGYTGSFFVASPHSFLGIPIVSSDEATVASLPLGVSDLVTSITRRFSWVFTFVDGAVTGGTGSIQYTFVGSSFNYFGAPLTLTPTNLAPGTVTVSLNTSQFTAVPSPEAGAGIGALAMGGMAFWVKRRRKDQALAA